MKEQLQVAAEAVTASGVDEVWALVSDANTYPEWGPWNAGGYRPATDGPSRIGDIQWFRFGRRTVSVEEILEIDAPRRLVYRVVKGIPVRNYRAEVTLTPSAWGTTVRWSATWDNTLLGRLVHRKLVQLYPEIVNALVAAADRARTGESSR